MSKNIQKAPVRVCVVASNNGAGLSRDLRLIGSALSSAGYEVSIRPLGRGKLRKWLRPAWARARNAAQRLLGGARVYDVNLMLEHIRPEYLARADFNVLIPNPEYFLPSDHALLPAMDAVFAKTRHAEAIFHGMGCATRFIGFTSEDRLRPGIEKRQAFFHLAGRSGGKGTQAVLEAWRAHPEWPLLTVVQSPHIAQPGQVASNIDHVTEYVDDARLAELQNSHRFHLCPSETEGFGHYLMEALSVGAVTLTTDGEPMNELVSPQRGLLIAVADTGRQAAARTWKIRPSEIEAAVLRALSLDESDCDALGVAARDYFLESGDEFRDRLQSAIARLVDDRAPVQAASVGRLYGNGLARSAPSSQMQAP